MIIHITQSTFFPKGFCFINLLICSPYKASPHLHKQMNCQRKPRYVGFRFTGHINVNILTELDLLCLNFLAIYKNSPDWVNPSLPSMDVTTNRRRCWKSLFGRGSALHLCFLN